MTSPHLEGASAPAPPHIHHLFLKDLKVYRIFPLLTSGRANEIHPRLRSLILARYNNTLSTCRAPNRKKLMCYALTFRSCLTDSYKRFFGTQMVAAKK